MLVVIIYLYLYITIVHHLVWLFGERFQSLLSMYNVPLMLMLPLIILKKYVKKMFPCYKDCWGRRDWCFRTPEITVLCLGDRSGCQIDSHFV